MLPSDELQSLLSEANPEVRAYVSALDNENATIQRRIAKLEAKNASYENRISALETERDELLKQVRPPSPLDVDEALRSPELRQAMRRELDKAEQADSQKKN